MSKYQRAFKSWQKSLLSTALFKSHFFQNGLPFITLVLMGAYGMHFFTQLRYDKSLSDSKSDRSILYKIAEKTGMKVVDNPDSREAIIKDLEEKQKRPWKNIRGPRDYEDPKHAKEFYEIKAKLQEKRKDEVLARQKALLEKMNTGNN